jgi:hypothetical protein
VQGNNPPRGGGAGFPITGEQPSTTLVSGNYAWNLNTQGGFIAKIWVDCAGRRAEVFDWMWN